MSENEVYDTSSDLEENDLEDDGILDASDTLEGDVGDDPLDTGIAPPDRWSAGEGFGTTLAEERAGESLDQLLAEEEPDTDPYADTDLFSDGPLADDSEPGPAGWSPTMRECIQIPSLTWSPTMSASMAAPPRRRRQLSTFRMTMAALRSAEHAAVNRRYAPATAAALGIGRIRWD